MNLRMLSALLLCLFGCSSTEKPRPTSDAGRDAVTQPDATIPDAPRDKSEPPPPPDGEIPDASPPDSGSDASPPLECFELSLDPEMPLALDGVFDASSELWRRPHDEDPVCPASALLPTTAAKVPFVAYAFCNNDSKPHTFDIEMISDTGTNGEPPLDDPYLVLYEGKKIPDDPLQCLEINDTIPDALETDDAEILGVTVPPGGAITVVGTTYTFDPTDGTGTGYYILVVTVNDP